MLILHLTVDILKKWFCTFRSCFCPWPYAPSPYRCLAPLSTLPKALQPALAQSIIFHKWKRPLAQSEFFLICETFESFLLFNECILYPIPHHFFRCHFARTPRVQRVAIPVRASAQNASPLFINYFLSFSSHHYT